jgi:glycosyltransferase involved in cell wall biosynthesis
MKKILILTKHGKESASSRQRFFKYFAYWEKAGFSIRLNQLLDEDYLQYYNAGISYNRFKLLKNYVRRLIFLCKYGFHSDIIFIHRGELFPMIPTTILLKAFQYIGVKIIVDYDDAVFHSYDKRTWVRKAIQSKHNSIIKLVDCVITGSPYLTSYCKKLNNKIVEIPTSIDLDEYKLGNSKSDNFSIGWIGSKSTSLHLNLILPILLKFAEKYSVKIKLIGYAKSLNLINDNVQIVDWQEGKDYELLRDIKIGIMPLKNEDYEKGKCGFKLVQYMASAKPFLASPLEANLKIDKNNQNLFAETNAEWMEALETVYKNYDEFYEIGLNNRLIAEQFYSIQSNAKIYVDIFKNI